MNVIATFARQQPWGRSIGLIVLTILIGFALLQPWVYDASPAQQNLRSILQPPSWQEPFGTDHLGRSMVARIGEGLRLSLIMSGVAVLFAALPGVFLGVLSGWRGGHLDRALTTIADSISALPGLLLILLIAGFSGGAFMALSLAIATVLWLEFFRVSRAQTRTLVTGPEIQASRLLGFGHWYCFRRHLWPALSGNIALLLAANAGQAILALATLGFISVGLKPPLAELGYMMTELFPHYYDAPYIFFQPVLAVFLLVLSFNLIAVPKNQ